MVMHPGHIQTNAIQVFYFYSLIAITEVATFCTVTVLERSNSQS